MKTTSKTDKKRYAFESAPRCGARTKSNNGLPCRCPAVRGKSRCRVHGGAIGSGAPQNNINAFKHGSTTIESKAEKSKISQILKLNRKIIHELN